MSDSEATFDGSSEGSLLLHYFENTQLILSVPAIACITFYKSTVSTSDSEASRTSEAQQNAVNFLGRRVDEIVSLNPWLCGQIVRDAGGTRVVFPLLQTEGQGEGVTETGSNARSYDTGCSTNKRRRYFDVVEDYCLGPHLSYEQIRDRVKFFSVKEGFQCLLPGELMFRVVVILTGPDSLAIVCSISHVVADGHTFYELYGMLSHRTQARQLVAKRNMLFKPLYEAVTDGDDTTRWLFSLGATLKMLFTLAFGRRTRNYLRFINVAAVSALKEIFAASLREGQFVSTNDILTSWLFLKCKSDLGIMAFNLRGRLAELTHDHAGNYEGLVAYQKRDFEHPVLIRNSLDVPYKRRVTHQLPGFFASITCRVTMLSSWATFYRDVEVDQFEQIIHLPCIDDKMVPLDNIGVIFRPRRDSLAVLLMGRSVSLDALRGDPLVGASVLPSGPDEEKDRKGVLGLTARTALGIGSAAFVAALLYARSRRWL
jgi:hypothetical protein